MKNNSTIYHYQHEDNIYDISFLKQKNNHMVNATEMAKPFNKQITHFLEDPNRYKYVIRICQRNSLIMSDNDIPLSLSISELAKLFSETIIVVKGGINKQQGTWFHEDIAIEFARWLSVDFSIWCNDRIKELLKNGYVYLITARPNGLEEHVNHQIQRENSKAMAIKNYGVDKNQKKIINHYRILSQKLVGVHPNEIIAWGKENNIPTKILNRGSREVLRYISSSATACMSLLENIIASSPKYTTDNLDELLPYIELVEPFFRKMIDIGYCDENDLKKIREYEKIKKGLNEK
jgi:hypothetical protein